MRLLMSTKIFQITFRGELEDYNPTADELRYRLLSAFPYAHGSEIEVTEGSLGCIEVTDDDIRSLREEARSRQDYALVKACARALVPERDLNMLDVPAEARALHTEARATVAQIILQRRRTPCDHEVRIDDATDTQICVKCGERW